jgi:hypothetical protein
VDREHGDRDGGLIDTVSVEELWNVRVVKVWNVVHKRSLYGNDGQVRTCGHSYHVRVPSRNVEHERGGGGVSC